MNFAKLNRQVVIENYTETRTASGDVSRTWATLSTRFAKVEYKTGGEKNEANQIQGYNVVEFTIRYCSTISATEQMRVKYNNQYFDVEFVSELGNREYQKLTTRRKTVWQEQ
jgi:SPP1 family predicted phage head-tail adaptor